MTLALRYAALSHVGLLRTGNEDSAYAGPRLLAVADGMGGHAAGEVASAVAIAAIAALDEDAPGADLLDELRQAALGANEHLRTMVQGDAALDGMGTTLTTLLFTGTRLGLLHIGDSRGYLLRDGVLTQITHDDTLVQTLVDEGRISPDEASSHPQRNMILRALDGREDVEFDLSVREARAGDRYLLCSDGLTGPVGHENLQEALSRAAPQEAAERLLELALRGGGPDNITVLVADVVDGDGAGVPVVAGAAAESPQPLPAHLTSGAAGRAAAERPAPVVPEPPVSVAVPAPRRRRVLRSTVVVLVVLGVLAAGLGTGRAYVRSQWYVGTDGDQVSVFRGLSGSVAGLDLSSVQQRTTLSTQALTELDRQDVERGIQASSPADARRIVGVLQHRAVCAPAAGTPQPGSTVPAGTPTPTGSTDPTGPPTPTGTPDPTGTLDPTSSQEPTGTPTPSVSTGPGQLQPVPGFSASAFATVSSPAGTPSTTAPPSAATSDCPGGTSSAATPTPENTP